MLLGVLSFAGRFGVRAGPMSRSRTKDRHPGPLRAEERLYLNLLDTPLLNTTGFLQNKNLIRTGESFEVAYLIVSGEVLVNHAEKT